MDKKKYKCSKCGYDFTRNSDLEIAQCPYCGTRGTVEPVKGNSASKLLRED